MEYTAQSECWEQGPGNCRGARQGPSEDPHPTEMLPLADGQATAHTPHTASGERHVLAIGQNYQG
jgi:hypothetical protein